jgi:rubrerythrin
VTQLPDLDVLDADGAIRDCAEAAGLDRSDFLKKGVLAGGGLLAGNALFGAHLSPAQAAISGRRSKRNDVKILNYALTLEYLEAEFYKQAVAANAAGDNAALRTFAEVVARHELQHVRFLQRALGSAAVSAPTFDFGNEVEGPENFARIAQELEDTGVRAYLGQVGNISNPAVLSAAGTIATVEARHAGWIRIINGAVPAPDDFDRPRSERDTLWEVADTGYFVTMPK